MKTDELRRIPVAVLMGGWSAEREVSLRTGAAVLAALEQRGYDCWGVDAGRDLAARLAERPPGLAFIALHGTGGEDGAVQGLLEVMGIRYTGSGILASALAMNKKVSKWLFERHGIVTPPWRSAGRGERVLAADLPFGLPAVVKPVAEGSTIGVGVAGTQEELDTAMCGACEYGGEAIIERFIAGRELTVGVLGRRALPAVEIVADGGFYDYRAKYQSPATSYVVPAELPEAWAGSLAVAAVRAVAVLGCRGQARVDFRVDASGVPWLLEVNTIPGMTETSLLPKAAAAAGMGFGDLVEEILVEAAVPA